MGGIVLQEIKTDDSLSGVGVNVITRVGVRIYETVPGKVVKSLEVNKFDYGFYSTGVKNFFKDLLLLPFFDNNFSAVAFGIFLY